MSYLAYGQEAVTTGIDPVAIAKHVCEQIHVQVMLFDPAKMSWGPATLACWYDVTQKSCQCPSYWTHPGEVSSSSGGIAQHAAATSPQQAPSATAATTTSPSPSFGAGAGAFLVAAGVGALLTFALS